MEEKHNDISDFIKKDDEVQIYDHTSEYKYHHDIFK